MEDQAGTATAALSAPADAPAEVDSRLFASLDEDLGYPWRHLLQRTVVLPQHRVVFVDVPKAAATSTLWLLAAVAGVDPASFGESAVPEVSRGLAVHDMSRWPREHRFVTYPPEERREILTGAGWFRFAIVRHPGNRLWSGWQSKLLMREPNYVERFGDRPWFPRLPSEPQDIIDDFRAFVRVLGDPDAHDVHWCRQHELTEPVPLTHIGRVESLTDTWTALAEHVGRELPSIPRENASLFAMPPAAHDAETAAIVNRHYAGDLRMFGYDPVAPGSADNTEWEARVAGAVPALGLLADRHARIGDLSTVAQERRGAIDELESVQAQLDDAESRLERRAVRQGAAVTSPVITNLEHNRDFTVRWPWATDEGLEAGFTAVVRVKNEAGPLPFVLPPLLRAVHTVVLVDNGSTDGTPDIARRVAREQMASDRLEVVSYPFDVARCGPEHLGTPAQSLHSLTYFYNWSFSHVRTSYALKWDGDMVLTETGVAALKALEWQLEAREVIVTMPRYPLYVADDGTAFLDIGLANNEPWGWPNRPGYVHVKAMEWELPLWPENIKPLSLPDWSCVELKHLDADEFAHWSVEDFTASARTRRKRREWEVFHALHDGSEPPDGVLRVDAPAGEHVIDYVRTTWLRDRKAELSELTRAARLRTASNG